MKKNKTPITIKKLLSLTCDSLEDDKAIDITEKLKTHTFG